MKTSRWLALGAGAAAGALWLRARLKRDPLQHKSVLITGGSRGLGLELARRCLERGARVAILARDEETLARAASQLGDDVLAIACDVADEEGMQHAVAQVTEAFGRVDVLMHCAGQIMVGPATTMDVEDYRNLMNTHLLGAVHGVNAVLPQMRARGDGRIVLISSIGGKLAVPHLLPYSASKFALAGYGEGLHAELARDGINVTTVWPGLMRTGSPRNADFKGQHQREYTWFMVADSLPLLTLNARVAAHRIVDACERRQAELGMLPLGRWLLAAKALFPELTAQLMVFANGLLPAPGNEDHASWKGHQSESKLTRSRITRLTRAAEARNNELQFEGKGS